MRPYAWLTLAAILLICSASCWLFRTRKEQPSQESEKASDCKQDEIEPPVMVVLDHVKLAKAGIGVNEFVEALESLLREKQPVDFEGLPDLPISIRGKTYKVRDFATIEVSLGQDAHISLSVLCKNVFAGQAGAEP